MLFRKPIFYLLGYWIALLISLLAGLPEPAADSTGPQKLTFFNLSDLHFAAEGEHAEDGFNLSQSIGGQLRELVATFNANEPPDFVVLTGDLVVEPSESNLAGVRKILDGLEVPYYVVPGNHDIPHGKSRGKGKAGSASFAQIFEGRGPKEGRSFWAVDPKKGWHLVGLDSTARGTWGGRIGAEQLRWLEEDLGRNTGKPTIVLCHHGLIAHHPWDGQGSWKGYLTDNAEEVRAVLERHRSVFLVVTGHHHLFAHQSWNGIEYVSCPALASWPCRYSRFVIEGDRLEVTNHPIPSALLVEKARNNLLNYKKIRELFPPGREQDELFLQLFSGPQKVSVQIPALKSGASVSR